MHTDIANPYSFLEENPDNYTNCYLTFSISDKILKECPKQLDIYTKLKDILINPMSFGKKIEIYDFLDDAVSSPNIQAEANEFKIIFHCAILSEKLKQNFLYKNNLYDLNLKYYDIKAVSLILIYSDKESLYKKEILNKFQNLIAFKKIPFGHSKNPDYLKNFLSSQKQYFVRYENNTEKISNMARWSQIRRELSNTFINFIPDAISFTSAKINLDEGKFEHIFFLYGSPTRYETLLFALDKTKGLLGGAPILLHHSNTLSLDYGCDEDANYPSTEEQIYKAIKNLAEEHQLFFPVKNNLSNSAHRVMHL